RSLTGRNVVFRTLPITGYATIDGQDANVVNPAYINSIVHATFYPPPAPRHGRHRLTAATSKPATVDVFNGGYTAGLAAQVSAALVKVGYPAGTVANTSYRTTTAVRYGPGASASADKIAAAF